VTRLQDSRPRTRNLIPSRGFKTGSESHPASYSTSIL